MARLARPCHLAPYPMPPTLGPSIRRLEVRAPAIMERAFVDQLRRAKVFGY